MWIKEASKKIADVLNIIADPPNLRPHPEDFSGSVKLFDSGQVIYQTGVTRFEFSKGTTAFFGTNSALVLTIDFPSGKMVLIRIESPELI